MRGCGTKGVGVDGGSESSDQGEGRGYREIQGSWNWGFEGKDCLKTWPQSLFQSYAKSLSGLEKHAAEDNPGTTLRGLTQSRMESDRAGPRSWREERRRLHPDVLLYAPLRSRTRRRKKGEGSQRQ